MSPRAERQLLDRHGLRWSGRCRLFVSAAVSAGVVGLASCGTSDLSGDRRLAIADFARTEDALRAEGLAVSTHVMSPQVTEGPEVAVTEVISADGTRVEASAVVRERRADGTTAVDASSPLVVASRVDPGNSWPVDALVGQINGRPIFADSFFEPIAEELVAAASNPDRAVGRQQFVGAVKALFKRTVDNELIVAEAESQLSPEQQQGLFAWVRSIQEETIAERGGSRAAAEASLASEEDKSLDEFLAQRRDVALAMRLLNQRIEPRAIVSWREVLQAYERDVKVYNPPRQIRIGRIQLDPATEAERVARVEAMVAEGKPFSAIVGELGIANGGLWQSSDLGDEGIDGLPLTDAVKSRIKDLPVDRVSPSLQQRGLTSWFAVLSIDQPVARSVYDMDLQLAITAQLRDIRRAIERQRYIGTLRSRWVTDDISAMEERLVAFALERYWR
ncbi:MAG: hypothetical protein RL354_1298 [Planctomycetota bacterium]